MKALFSFRRWFCLGLCAALAVSRAAAQSADSPQENRFLIVVETASSMRRSSNAVAQAVTELFQTDMKGEFRPGDTIGVWNYSDKLHTDFPMQVWKGTNGAHIQHNVMAYLREQRYEKRGHLEKALAMLGQIIAESHRLTIIFIFDGTEPIKGTPFDADINNTHKKFGSEFRSEHVPFVTVLSSREGTIFDYTVNTPGSIKLPHTALPYKPEPTISAPVAVVAPPVIVPEAPPPPHKHIEIVMAGPTAASVRPMVVPAAVEPPVAPTNEVAASVESNSTVSAAITAATPPTPNAIPESKTVAETVTNVATNAPVAAIVPAPAVPPSSPATPPTPASPAHTNAALFALFTIAFSLLAIAIGLFWSLARRGRGAGSPSLISQSMDRSR
jgi:hypothetical protein